MNRFYHQPFQKPIRQPQTRALAELSLDIARSSPPTRMPACWRCWRTWWRTALTVMRRAGIRDRAARDAMHERLLAQFQAAALRASEEGQA